LFPSQCERKRDALIAGDAKAAGVVLRCVATRSKLLGLEASPQMDVRVREGETVLRDAL
jgi:hypothetical protein